MLCHWCQLTQVFLEDARCAAAALNVRVSVAHAIATLRIVATHVTQRTGCRSVRAREMAHQRAILATMFMLEKGNIGTRFG